ncbi:hypothetical protein H0X32_03110 [Patescibacteria group bacterium]|nr:hypothetical protein [Patescibacteria group bacterium]
MGIIEESQEECIFSLGESDRFGSNTKAVLQPSENKRETEYPHENTPSSTPVEVEEEPSKDSDLSEDPVLPEEEGSLEVTVEILPEVMCEVASPETPPRDWSLWPEPGLAIEYWDERLTRLALIRLECREEYTELYRKGLLGFQHEKTPRPSHLPSLEDLEPQEEE